MGAQQLASHTNLTLVTIREGRTAASHTEKFRDMKTLPHVTQPDNKQRQDSKPGLATLRTGLVLIPRKCLLGDSLFPFPSVQCSGSHRWSGCQERGLTRGSRVGGPEVPGDKREKGKRNRVRSKERASKTLRYARIFLGRSLRRCGSKNLVTWLRS